MYTGQMGCILTLKHMHVIKVTSSEAPYAVCNAQEAVRPGYYSISTLL
jgi:hypothetical protein